MESSSISDQPSSSSIPSNNSSDTSDEQTSIEAEPSTSRDPATPGQDSENKKKLSDLLNGGISENSLSLYNLYCLDEKLIPNSIKNKYDKSKMRKDLKDICFWMKPNLSSSETLDCLEILNKSCYVVRYNSQRRISPTEKFISRLFDEEVRTNASDKNVSAMIIIPIPDTSRALVYSFGRAQSNIMNKHAIIKQFGLELAASKDISSKSIKELTVLSQHEDKRKTKITKTSSPGRIGVFAPEAGAELFYKLCLKRDGDKRIVEGSTKFKFPLPMIKNKKGTQPSIRSDIQTLVAISRELYEVYTKNNIHPEYKDYISKEVDNALAIELNNELVKILTGHGLDYEKYFFNLNPEVLRREYEKKLKDVEEDLIRCTFLDSLRSTMDEDNANLESLINLNYDDGKVVIKEEPVCALLVVDAFAYGENLYNYTSGKWFQIPACRFPYIRKEIGGAEIGYEKLGLIRYTKEHDEKVGVTKKDKPALRKKKEFHYNADAAKALSKTRVPDIRGILCDHINVKYLSTNFTFEFADILTTNSSATELGESSCIIHVKRRAASDFEKQCMQLVRTQEFLYSMVGNKKYFKLPLQGCVNTLYASHDLPIVETWVVGNDKNLTHGIVPIKCPKGKEDWLNHVMKKTIRHCKDKRTAFQEAMLHNAPTFLKKYESLTTKAVEYLVVSMNALFYCDSKEKDLTLADAKIFCDLVQHFYGVATELFDKKTSQKTERQKNLYLVLAIVDDKGTGMQPNSEGKYVDNFTDQQLLSLEILKHKVEMSDFKFKWTVIEKQIEIHLEENNNKEKNGNNSSAGLSQMTKND